jgi:hypothetical protein
VPDNKLNAPVSTWTRNTYGAALTAAASTYLGGGQYRVTTSLVKTCPWWFCSYHKQVVWRFRIPNSLTAQTLNLQSRVTHPGYWVLNSTSAANLRLVTTSEALIVTNRTQLYENHSAWEATSLLAQVYNVAQGSPYNDQPLGVVYNADLYDADIATWDNTAVNYTSETTANAVADEVDDLIEDWVEDGTWTWSYHYWFSTTVSIDLYPYYLLLVGDDDVLPFYRYNDPSNDEGINKISWCAHGWCTDSDTNPAIHATDEDYFFTTIPTPICGAGRTGALATWNWRPAVGRRNGGRHADPAQQQPGDRWRHVARGDGKRGRLGVWVQQPQLPRQRHRRRAERPGATERARLQRPQRHRGVALGGRPQRVPQRRHLD